MIEEHDLTINDIASALVYLNQETNPLTLNEITEPEFENPRHKKTGQRSDAKRGDPKKRQFNSKKSTSFKKGRERRKPNYAN